MQCLHPLLCAILTLSASSAWVLPANSVPKTILYWSPFEPDGESPLIMHTDAGDCIGVRDRNLLHKADVVNFYGRTDRYPFPTETRRSGTLWVYHFYESPSYYGNRDLDFIGQVGHNINMIMTYDSRSDIYAPYGSFYKLETPLTHIDTHFSSKSELIVWLPSNCDSHFRSQRLMELERHIRIDVLGGSRCSNMPSIPQCQGDRNNNASHYDCFVTLGKKYKFYFALENSDCTDYITEKVWRNSFAGGMIPVVWGSRSNYAQHLPPNSFINCADFSSALDCSLHIEKVGSEQHLYDSYHEWRKQYGTEFWTKPIFNQLCEYVHKHGDQEKAAVDLAGIRSVENCNTPQDW